MGTDIHTFVEQRCADGTWEYVTWPGADEYTYGPFSTRDYPMFAFLADVKNRCYVPPVMLPRGSPADASRFVCDELVAWGDVHDHGWLYADELVSFDYDATFRIGNTVAGWGWSYGQVVTYREFLHESYFVDLARLATMNADRTTRVVFWFDN